MKSRSCWTHRQARRAVVGALASAAALGGVVITVAAQPNDRPVLGSKVFIWHGSGWGKVAPARIDNNGDPGGNVDHVTWRNWGGETTIGTGVGSIANPHGTGWIGGQHVQLRASHLGRCAADGRSANRQLDKRYPRRPGGRLGPWRPWWPGKRDLCHPVH